MILDKSITKYVPPRMSNFRIHPCEALFTQHTSPFLRKKQCRSAAGIFLLLTEHL